VDLGACAGDWHRLWPAVVDRLLVRDGNAEGLILIY
jgi:hypothetical protein